MICTNSDGGARGNPGPGAIGVIVRKDGEEEIFDSKIRIKLKIYGIIFITSVSYALSLPKFDLWFLSFFFLIPLLYLTERTKCISPFRIFFIFSFFAHLIILYWIPEVMISYGGMNSAIGILGLILLSLYISLFYGLSGIFIKKAFAINTFSPFLIPFIWISKEFVSVLTVILLKDIASPKI